MQITRQTCWADHSRELGHLSCSFQILSIGLQQWVALEGLRVLNSELYWCRKATWTYEKSHKLSWPKALQIKRKPKVHYWIYKGCSCERSWLKFESGSSRGILKNLRIRWCLEILNEEFKSGINFKNEVTQYVSDISIGTEAANKNCLKPIKLRSFVHDP